MKEGMTIERVINIILYTLLGAVLGEFVAIIIAVFYKLVGG